MRRVSRRFSEGPIEGLASTQTQVLDAIRELDFKLMAIAEAVGAQNLPPPRNSSKDGPDDQRRRLSRSCREEHSSRRHREGEWEAPDNILDQVAEARRSRRASLARSDQAQHVLPALQVERQASALSTVLQKEMSNLFQGREVKTSREPSHKDGEKASQQHSRVSREPSHREGDKVLHLASHMRQMESLAGMSSSSSGRLTEGMSASSGSSAQSYRRHRNISSHSSDYDSEAENKVCHAWDPDSVSRTIFDVVCIMMLLYDAFMVPYLLAYQIPSDGIFLDVSVWTTRLFWTLDLLLNLCTGYRTVEARLVLNISKAMRRYITTWFVFDLLLVTIDWLTIVSQTGGENWMRWARAMRLVRSGRQVFRGYTLVLKAKLMINDAKGFLLVLDLSLFVIIILWVNHVVSCGWYGIGRQFQSVGQTWLSSDDFIGHEEGGVASHYVYWTALHWAMTQMTPGSMEVVPRCTAERVYNVIVLLFGMLMGSSLVATLTSMLTQYKMRVEGSSRKFMILHQFLQQQGVDPKLALAIKLQVKGRSSEKNRLKAQDVEFLSLLSKSMQDKLWHSWCMQHLARHQLLNSLELVDPLAVKTVCKAAIQPLDFAAHDTVFEEGTKGESMYIIIFGQLQYSTEDFALEAMVEQSELGFTLRAGSWCCEPALWIEWCHAGTMEATADTEVLQISGPRFTSAMSRFPAANVVVMEYSMAFFRHINEPSTIKSDLPSEMDICELLSSLPTETRQQIARPAIMRLEGSFWEGMPFINKAHLERLREEVANGKCDVGLQEAEVVRNVSIVALRIHKRALHDRILVRVGEMKADGSVVANCVLPGVKRRFRETDAAAVGRILEEELGEISKEVDLHLEDGCTRRVSVEESPTYGIRTRYLRSTFNATLASSARLRVYATEPMLTRRGSHFLWGSTSSSLQLRSPNCCWPSLSRARKCKSREQKQFAGEVLASLRQVTVLKRGKDCKSVYLWLTAHQHEVLSDPGNKPLLQGWLASLSLEGEGEWEGGTSSPRNERLESKQVAVNPEINQAELLVEVDEGEGDGEGPSFESQASAGTPAHAAPKRLVKSSL